MPLHKRLHLYGCGVKAWVHMGLFQQRNRFCKSTLQEIGSVQQPGYSMPVTIHTYQGLIDGSQAGFL